MADPWNTVAAVGGAVGTVTGLAALAVAVWAARSSSKSAAAARESAAIARDRHRRDLAPVLKCELRVDRSTSPAVAELSITLDGPLDLDGVAVAIRDDRPDRAPRTAGGPTAEDIAATVWGPWRFRPGVDDATHDGRAVPARPLARLGTLTFALEPSPAPRWTTPERRTTTYRRAPLRLRITCTHTDHEPWTLNKDVTPPTTAEIH